MANVTFRFYGRFVYAEAMNGDDPANRISAIAPNFDVKRFGKHQALMSIQRDLVDFGDDGQGTTLPPSFRMVTDRPEITDAELFVWDLSGLKVTYDLKGPVSLTEAPREESEATKDLPPRRVLDLESLEALRKGPKPELALTALRSDARGRTNAIVELTAGVGVAKPIIESSVQLVKESDAIAARDAELQAAQGGKPVKVDIPVVLENGEPFKAVPADLVEFRVPLRDRTLTLTFLNSGDEKVGVVTVKSETTVAFSNLCCDLRAPGLQDLEFSQYYQLLRTAPGPDALIPVEIDQTGLGEGEDCDLQARLKFQLS